MENRRLRRKRVPEGKFVCVSPEKRMLRREAAASYCGMSAKTFLALVESGTLPEAVLRRGRLTLWDRCEIDRALDRLQRSDGSGWDDI
jgi:predicted DNA-binding transcriptional regulator AlpA